MPAITSMSAFGTVSARSWPQPTDTSGSSLPWITNVGIAMLGNSWHEVPAG